MSNRINLSSFSPGPNDKIFVDNNVFMYMFYIMGNYQQEKVDAYSNTFKSMLINKSIIYTSSIVLSEFFNSYMKIEYSLLKNQYPNYKKDFRPSVDFSVLSKEITNIIKNKILTSCKKINDDFDIIDINSILKNEENIPFDFNDKYIATLCEKNKIKILTDDKDFLNFNNNMDIITF